MTSEMGIFYEVYKYGNIIIFSEFVIEDNGRVFTQAQKAWVSKKKDFIRRYL